MTPEEKKEVVIIDKFLTLQNNTVSNIAALTGLRESTVHLVINKYLKGKTINAES